MPLLNATTKLEAVNTMLFTIGESPTNSLSGKKAVDVVTAERILDTVSREVQGDGWAFNTEKKFPLKRVAFDPKEIPVPPNALHCDPTDKSLNIVVRGSRLYDNDAHSFVFPNRDMIECDIIWLLPFDQLPEAARQYITVKAARRFQAGAVGSETLDQFTVRDEYDAFRRFRKHNARVRDKNLAQSLSVQKILNR